MGGRWAWHALCENGHRFGGFSAGSDGECPHCHSREYKEISCAHWDGTGDCETDCYPGLIDAWK